MSLLPAYGNAGSSGAGTPVSQENLANVVYIKGDADTDGSIRVVPDITFGTEAEFQRRASGVWNDTGIQIAGSTVYLGRELRLSSGGQWLMTRDASEGKKALVPQMEFTDAAGSRDMPFVAALDAKSSDVPIQTDGTGEFVGTSFSYNFTSASIFLFADITLHTGATAATSPVTVTFRRASLSGQIFYTRTFPASAFAANTAVRIETDSLVEFNPDDVAFVILESATNFSLETNLAGDSPRREGSFFRLTEVGVVTDANLQSRFLLDGDGQIIFDNAGAPVINGSSI